MSCSNRTYRTLPLDNYSRLCLTLLGAATANFCKSCSTFCTTILTGCLPQKPSRELPSVLSLLSYEAGAYEDGLRRFEKIVRFATIPTVKAGWLAKERGRWSVTESGWQARTRYLDPEEFVRRSVELYHNWKKGQPGLEVPLDDDDGPAGTSAGITFEQAEEQAWGEIERYLGAMPPYDFQELVAALLRAMGYSIGWIAPPGKDGGVDIVAFNDPLGTRPPRIKVQVKRQQGKVNVDGLRSFMALLGADDVGIFVNAGGFTKDAEDEGRSQQVRRVTLIDLERLVDLWKEHYPKLNEGARLRLPLQPIFFLAPE